MNSRKINRRRVKRNIKSKKNRHKMFKQQGGSIKWDNLALSVFLGPLGIDRFYHGCWKSGAGKLISQTIPPIGTIWWLADIGYAVAGKKGYIGCNDWHSSNLIKQYQKKANKSIQSITKNV